MTLPLPQCPGLPIALLAASFNNTSATYKYYWLLSILSELEGGNTVIPKHRLFAGMVSRAWYTVNYFHVSFGKQDQLQRAINQIRELEGITIDEKEDIAKHKIIKSLNPATAKTLRYFDSEVPHRYLSPWFPQLRGNRTEIYCRSADFENDCPYALDEQNLTINPRWHGYLVEHAGILKAFCYWHLSLYLQKHNPNVPDIPNKLIKPARRNSLLNQRKFWNRVLDHTGPLECIYTQKKLTHGSFAVEHFIPYAFVSHDLIWNLIPADPSFNSRKNDKLPRMEDYFDGYYLLQKTAIEVMAENYPNEPIMEDYLSLSPNSNAQLLPEADLRDRFLQNIQPLLTIANNNGFEYLRKID
ncbi:HNH endonuclease domain-containing protein [Pedobacter sp. KACC 23697]|uniref:HNH endonuclease domain-containing protein n=1 Tax=Pedobacter sp. KACC 23697 TaxID=3149230 RepID=A0AAU7K252_9SPHI